MTLAHEWLNEGYVRVLDAGATLNSPTVNQCLQKVPGHVHRYTGYLLVGWTCSLSSSLNAKVRCNWATAGVGMLKTGSRTLIWIQSESLRGRDGNWVTGNPACEKPLRAGSWNHLLPSNDLLAATQSLWRSPQDNSGMRNSGSFTGATVHQPGVYHEEQMPWLQYSQTPTVSEAI